MKIYNYPSLFVVFVSYYSVIGLKCFFILIKRGNFGEERYEKVDFQIKVKEQFVALMEADSTNNRAWHVLDARKSISELQTEIQNIADSTILRVKNEPINKLWLDT